MSRPLFSGLFAAALLLGGCQSEIDNKPAAQVAPAPAPAAAPPPAAEPPPAPAPSGPTTAATFSNEGSKIEWIGAKITKDHLGGFHAFTGTAELVGDQVVKARVEIQLDSVFTDSEKLVGHLKSPDFFDVARFATATFETSAITAGGTGGSHTVTGTLDLHGVKKEVTFPATITAADGKTNVKAEFTINRKDWDISYPGKPDDLIKDDVLIRLDVNLAAQAG
ncbi:YceI family protein [Myxococcota bacterium]|nr:YceI family protein [Myxococcota bacterium]